MTHSHLKCLAAISYPLKAFKVLLLWQHAEQERSHGAAGLPCIRLEQQNNLEQSSRKCPQTQTTHTDQAPDYLTTDTQCCEQNKLTVCAGTPAMFPHRDLWGSQHTVLCQIPLDSTDRQSTFHRNQVLTLPPLLPRPSLSFPGWHSAQQLHSSTSGPHYRSQGPQLHPTLTLPLQKWDGSSKLDAKNSMWQFSICT